MRITVWKSTLYCELLGSQQRCSGIWLRVNWWIVRRFRRNLLWSSYSWKRQQTPSRCRLLFRNRHGSVSQKTIAFKFIVTICVYVFVRTCIIYIGLVKGRVMRRAKHAARKAHLLQESVPKDYDCEILSVVSRTQCGNIGASLWCIV
jgi:hypothetical protein